MVIRCVCFGDEGGWEHRNDDVPGKGRRAISAAPAARIQYAVRRYDIESVTPGSLRIDMPAVSPLCEVEISFITCVGGWAHPRIVT